MSVRIIDERKTNLVPIISLKHGDGFIHEGDLYMVLSDDQTNDVFCTCLNITATVSGYATKIVCNDMLLNSFVEPVTIDIVMRTVEIAD